jgi:hypothetical protein
VGESVEAVTGIVTSRDGRIVDLSDAGSRLLNVSARGLERRVRTLVVFFDGARHAVLAAQALASPEPCTPFPSILRPLEHATRPVSVTVRELPDGFLEWTILPTDHG